MITLYRGELDQSVQEVDINVASPKDYVAARQAIRDALMSGADLRIHVSNAIIQNWFWDLQDHPGFQEYNYDPREELERKLGISLPRTITKNLIEELDLLMEEEPPKPPADAFQWIAEKRLHEIWSGDHPSLDHVRALVGWFVDQYDQNIAKLPSTLWTVMEGRLKYWEHHANRSLKNIYSALRLQPTDIVQFLCAWDALSSYLPETRKLWLENLGWYTAEREDLATNLDNLPSNPAVDQALKNLVIPYWNNQLTKKFEEEIHASQ